MVIEVSAKDRKSLFDEVKSKAHANYLYQAQIKTADIIAYVDDEEREVLQYRKVFDIQDITDRIGE